MVCLLLFLGPPRPSALHRAGRVGSNPDGLVLWQGSGLTRARLRERGIFFEPGTKALRVRGPFGTSVPAQAETLLILRTRAEEGTAAVGPASPSRPPCCAEGGPPGSQGPPGPSTGRRDPSTPPRLEGNQFCPRLCQCPLWGNGFRSGRKATLQNPAGPGARVSEERPQRLGRPARALHVLQGKIWDPRIWVPI